MRRAGFSFYSTSAHGGYFLLAINVLSELERFGVVYEHAAENEVKTLCPFHTDHSPSCSVNIEKRVFKCHSASCGKGGDIITFLAAVAQSDYKTVAYELAQRYGTDGAGGDVKVIEAATVEQYHNAIWLSGPLLEALYARGVTDAMIRKYRLGVHGDRITIPIKNSEGVYVNVRKYKPGASGRDKMRNVKGHGEVRLFPVEQFRYSKILLCGGEIKAIVAAAQVNKYSIGAVSATGGEGNWHEALTRQFKDRHVWVCFDVDKGGLDASELRCGQLRRIAEWVGNVHLPLDLEKYPHGDINDFIAKENGELKPLLDACEQWQPGMSVADKLLLAVEPVEVRLSQITELRDNLTPIKFDATVTAHAESDYLIPVKSRVACKRGQEICALCPVNDNEADQVYETCRLPETVLLSVNNTKFASDQAVLKEIGVPQSCRICSLETVENKSVFVTFVTTPTHIENTNAMQEDRHIYSIGTSCSIGSTNKFTGNFLRHPKDGAGVVVAHKCEPVEDTLQTYQSTNLDQLRFFQPKEWSVESILEKLNERYDDIEQNVTQIFLRRDMHFVIDLTYHSVLSLAFGNKTVNGWVQSVIVGDTSQGKSDATRKLKEHYKLGDMHDCKNASRSGLVAGVDRKGSMSVISWGVLPRNDRGLVVLDELGGLSVEDLTAMTAARDGMVDITKIRSGKAYARTRIAATSNPRENLDLSKYAYGIKAIADLFVAPQDLRRIDLAYIAASGEAMGRREYQNALQPIEPQYTSDLCRELILFAWSRSLEQIRCEPGVMEMLHDAAEEMYKTFGCKTLPLIDDACENKILKLAASLASLTYSVNTHEPTVLVIRKCHIEYIRAFMLRIYSLPSFAYDKYKNSFEQDALIDEREVEFYLGDAPQTFHFISLLQHADTFTRDDLVIWLSDGRMEPQNTMRMANMLLKVLTVNRAVVKANVNRHFRKTGALIELLDKMLADPKRQNKPIEKDNF